MALTRLAVAQVLPRVLAQLVCEYFGSSQDDWANGYAGRYELCASARCPNAALAGALVGAHLDVVRLLVETRAVCGLLCTKFAAKHRYEHAGLCHSTTLSSRFAPEVARYLLRVFATDVRHRLYYHCYVGDGTRLGQLQTEVRQLGHALDWNYGLAGACASCDWRMMCLALARGATQCLGCDHGLAWHAARCGYRTRRQRAKACCTTCCRLPLTYVPYFLLGMASCHLFGPLNACGLLFGLLTGVGIALRT